MQWVASPTADPLVASSILAQFHTFVKIEFEIISTVILLLLLIQEELLSVTSETMCIKLCQLLIYSSLPRKKVWFGELAVSK